MREPDARLNPPLSSPTWAIRAPLVAWLREEADRAARDLGRYRVLDVGCGSRPYEPLFAPHAAEYVGVDSGNPAADLEGVAEELPVPDGSFDLVLCTQVLEHASDPARVVAELSRVTAPGGRVLASTHGVYLYHPNPVDLWRWTHAGLEKLFTDNGSWRAVTVRPGSGTAACVGMVVALYVSIATRRVAPLGRALISGINRGAKALDGRSAKLRGLGEGSLHANYHVVAEK